MSGKLNTEDILKSLVDAGIPEEEAISMIQENEDIAKAQKSEDTDEDGADAPDSAKENDKGGEGDDEDSFDEEKAKSLKKACDDSDKAYKAYMAKKPKEVEKSEEAEIEKSDEATATEKKEEFKEDFMKSFGEKFDSFQEGISEKLDLIKSQGETIEALTEQIDTLKSQVEEIGNQTPPAKSFGITNEAVIEKAVEGGVKQDGKVHMTLKTHKSQIGDALAELSMETEGSIQKAVETDMTNVVAGMAESISQPVMNLLSEKKNIIVH